MYNSTETAKHADLVLPAAAWGEKDGTFINSERRYGLLKKVRPAPGQALADFQIFRAVAHYWGVGEMFKQWTDPESVFRILQQLSEGQFCDITGIDGYAQLDKCGGIQWPWSTKNAEGGFQPEQQRRLFNDGQFCHPDKKAKLIVDSITPMPEEPDAQYPMLLLTGRGTVSQWHTQTRTHKSPVLRQLYPNEAYVEINPVDASELRIRNGDQVQVVSRRGKITLNAFVTPTVRQGQLFIPCLLYTSPSPRDATLSRMPSSA